jgi:hypothetical protein
MNGMNTSKKSSHLNQKDANEEKRIRPIRQKCKRRPAMLFLVIRERDE